MFANFASTRTGYPLVRQITFPKFQEKVISFIVSERGSMPKLVLVKHSLPEIRPDRAAAAWVLTDEGRKRAAAIARRIGQHQPDVLGASHEPKATETAEIIARTLGKSVEVVEGLHEQKRGSLELLPGRKFESAVAELFAKPGELVFGDETANQACDRFGHAVEHFLEAHPDENVALISHGRVITLLVADYAGVDPFPFWRRLGLPSFVVLSLPEKKILEVVESVL